MEVARMSTYPLLEAPADPIRTVRGRVDAYAGRLLAGVGAPALGTAAALTITGGSAASTAVLTAGSFLVTSAALRPLSPHARQLPLMRHTPALLGTVIAIIALAAASIP